MQAAVRAADLDAVTLDALGTLVRLRDPVEPLRAALAAHGVHREPELVRSAFAEEVAHYKPRCRQGRDAASLRALRQECAGVFLAAAGAEVEPASFADDFVAALSFEPEPGAQEAVEQLAGAGLRLAVVSNWDASLPDVLASAGVEGPFEAIVTSADAAADKPDPAIFRLALERLGTAPERTLHVGDDEVDAEGAARAGLAFRPAPLATVVEELL